MKFVNIFFVILFLLSAILQLNDSDSFVWTGIYLSGSLLCLLPLIGKGQLAFFWLALAFYLTYATYLFISPNGVLSWYRDHNAENIAQSMTAQKPWIEETREFFGLLILSSAAILNLLFQKNKRS
ncbi:transmembrane 220 family protein [Salinimicrobium marinum]|uniref:transmembrane 220 family protein n=1 Tax=Salinimicrobium marinum TaxID=680283 RepID=UPI0016775C23|nr:transmembrane 220 family protein [Salinimicrobium marinum]